MASYYSNLPNGSYDCHIHSCYSSDSNLKCSDILSIAKKKKLKLIAVTDHNTINGGLVTKSLARGSDIEVIVGAEIKTHSGEVIGLNLKEEIKFRSLIPCIEEIKRQNGLVVIPHPSRWNKKKIPISKIKKYVDYIEVYNGRNLSTISNLKAYKLASNMGIQTIVGSDAHFGFEIGNTKKDLINWKGFLGLFLTTILKFFYYFRRGERNV